MQIAQFKIPGQSGTQEVVQTPGGIPEGLSLQNIVQLSLQWLFLIAAILTVIFIMYSGVQWITSQGDPGKIASAKARLLYSVIGLVVVSSGYFIVRLVVTILAGGDAGYFFDFNNLGTAP
jgi:hypothetical protein